MAKSKALRFAAGTPTEVRSSVWTLFCHKKEHEFYLAAGESGRWMKFSFHESGRWRVALHDHVERKSDEDRALKKWLRPVDHPGGLTHVFTILVPPATVAEPFYPPPPTNANQIVWLPAPALGNKLLFLVFIAKSGLTKGTGYRGDRLVGSLRLRSGEHVVLLWRELPLSNDEHAHVEHLVGAGVGLKIHTADPAGMRWLRLHEVMTTPEGMQVLWDVTLGREHVYLAEQT